MGTSTLQDINVLDWSPGTVIGDQYVLVEMIEEDGTASVYRAETLDRQEPRLLRVLNARAAEHPAIAREFRETSELVRKISHPNLAVVEAIGEADGRPFVVTGAAEGRTLDQLVHDEGPLGPARVCVIAREIAAALEAAHRFGVLHLGLSPRQIIVSRAAGEEHVTVNGLGWTQLRMSRARRFISGGASSGRSLTIQDLLPAAPAYSAPETALSRSAEDLDGRADLYSLGVLTYELLMARLPRSAAPPDEDGLGMLVAQVDPTLPALEIDSSVPAPLAGLIRQLLETRRELRPSTAKVVKERFGRATVAAAAARPARETIASRQKQPVAIPKPIPPTVSQAAPPPPVVEPAPVAAGPPIPEPITPSPAPPQATIGPPVPPTPEPAPVTAGLPIPQPITPAPVPPQATIEPPAPPMPEPAPELLARPLPEPLATPVADRLPERAAPAEPVIADRVTAPEIAPEPAPMAAEVFAELNLEAPAPGEPPGPIVLRPGGRVIHETPAAAGSMTAPTGLAQSPVPIGGPDSVLFKTRQEPQPPAGWVRRALAVLAVALIFAAALFFIGESKKLQWNSPTPTSVDQEHSLSRPDANAEVTPTAPATKSPSNAAPAPARPSNGTSAQTPPQGSTSPATESGGTAAAGQAPATGVQATSGAHRAPLQPEAGAEKAAGASSSRSAAEAAAAEIQRAVSAGDVFYQTGQYDLAIQTYDEALQAHPQSELLRGRISRARKAKAAEQEYLGQ